MQTARQTVVISRMEQFLAILAAIACLFITLICWSSIRAQQTMWPLPGSYFMEMLALSVVSAFLVVRGDPRGSLATWGTAGAMSVFSILGAFSVGFFYLPVALLFGVVSVSWDIRNKESLPTHLGVFLIAGIVQLLLMLIVISLR